MNNLKSGLNDFLKSFNNKDLWIYLAFFDIKMKYRRSYIGPWWETLSAILIIGALGFLWSKIFHIDLLLYIPYFSIGFIFWLFIASQINESCEIFYLHQNVITNIQIPYHSFVLRLALKNLIILCHSFLILIPIILYSFEPNWFFFTSIIGVFILFFNLIFLSVIIAIFCLRFHDTKYAVGNIIQIVFFITPIVWMPKLISDKFWLMEFNPFYHWINLIREPILHKFIPLNSLIFSCSTILLLAIISFYIVGRVKTRIPLWY